MAGQSPPSSSDAPQAPQLPEPGSNAPPQRPWRTEGLPPGQSPPPNQRWTAPLLWVVGYLLLFGLLTIQDRLSGPVAIPYTEFKTQVATKNIAELFARGDSIEGQLRKAVPVPGQQDRT